MDDYNVIIKRGTVLSSPVPSIDITEFFFFVAKVNNDTPNRSVQMTVKTSVV